MKRRNRLCFFAKDVWHISRSFTHILHTIVCSLAQSRFVKCTFCSEWLHGLALPGPVVNTPVYTYTCRVTVRNTKETSRRRITVTSSFNEISTHKVLTYVDYKTVSGVFQNIYPHPLSTQRVCPLPAPMAGATHSPGSEGVGGQYFGRCQHWIGLSQYNRYVSTYQN